MIYLQALWIIFSLTLVLPSYVRADAQAASDFHFAAGLGSVFSNRGASHETALFPESFRISPEVVAYGYRPVTGSIWFRHGMRMSFAWLQQEMPQSLKIKEFDLNLMAEGGLVMDWILIPSLSLGAGVVFRNTVLETQMPLLKPTDDSISGLSLMPFVQAQMGLGIPLAKGTFVLEPYVRYVHLFQDARFNWAVGSELTVSLF